MRVTLVASDDSSPTVTAETAWTSQDEELFGLFQLNRACFDPRSDLAKRMAQRPAPEEVAQLLAAEAKPAVDQAPKDNAWTLQDEDLIGLFDAKAGSAQGEDLADFDMVKLAETLGYPVQA